MKLEFASFFDRFVRNVKKGKSFTLTGLTTFSRLLLLKYIYKLSGKNPELIDQLGLTLSPSRAEFLTRTHNRGILAGLSNDMLSYTRLTDFFFYFRGEVIYPHYRLRNLKAPATFGSLSQKKAGSAEVLIDPGAMLAIRNGSGTILVSTIRWSELSVSYSRHVLFFFRKRVDHERITAEFVFMRFLLQADCRPRDFSSFRIFQYKVPESFAVHLRSASDSEFDFGIFRKDVS